MVGISIVLFRGNSSSQLNLFFIYFHHNHLRFQLLTYIYLVLVRSSSYCFIFSLLSLVKTSVKYLRLQNANHVSENKVQRTNTISFYEFLDRRISNIANKNFLYGFSSILTLLRLKFSLLITSLKKQQVPFFISISLILLLIFNLYH